MYKTSIPLVKIYDREITSSSVGLYLGSQGGTSTSAIGLAARLRVAVAGASVAVTLFRSLLLRRLIAAIPVRAAVAVSVSALSVNAICLRIRGLLATRDVLLIESRTAGEAGWNSVHMRLGIGSRSSVKASRASGRKSEIRQKCMGEPGPSALGCTDLS